MNVIGIDITNRIGVNAVICSFGEFVTFPCGVKHTVSEFEELTKFLKRLNGKTKVSNPNWKAPINLTPWNF